MPLVIQTQVTKSKKIDWRKMASKNEDMEPIDIPKKAPRDKQLAFRLSTELFNRIEQLRAESQQDRSEVLVRLLKYALDAYDEQRRGKKR